MGRTGLLWIGERFYKTPEDFLKESVELGTSRRIKAIPRGFELGKTWVLLAHPKVRSYRETCEKCSGSGLVATDTAVAGQESCETCSGSGQVTKWQAGIFRIFKPERVEKLITDKQAADPEVMESLKNAGITPVVVPATDRDHQGTVYDVEDEEEEVVVH